MRAASRSSNRICHTATPDGVARSSNRSKQQATRASASPSASETACRRSNSYAIFEKMRCTLTLELASNTSNSRPKGHFRLPLPGHLQSLLPQFLQDNPFAPALHGLSGEISRQHGLAKGFTCVGDLPRHTVCRHRLRCRPAVLSVLSHVRLHWPDKVRQTAANRQPFFRNRSGHHFPRHPAPVRRGPHQKGNPPANAYLCNV